MKSIKGTCHHDCPDTCGWIVTVEDGVAVKLRGNPEHPYSKGELCPKVPRHLRLTAKAQIEREIGCGRVWVKTVGGGG